MPEQIEYITVVEPVLEVSLIGNASRESWQSLIQKENLVVEGNTLEIILSAVSAKYMGIPFRELSVSLRLNEDEFFLIHAYNSLWWFALAERKFFRTPYYSADIQVAPHYIQLSKGQNRVFEAKLADATKVIEDTAERNTWKIHLPRKLRKQAHQAHCFHAILEGATQYYDLASLQTTVSTQGHSEAVFATLAQSDFTVRQWLVREKARHSKSKTMVE